MQHDQNLKGRPAYDTSLESGARKGRGGSGAFLIGGVIIIAIFAAILWFGAGDEGRSLAPGMAEPEASVPVDPTVPAPIR